jgi:hypothetical protein
MNVRAGGVRRWAGLPRRAFAEGVAAAGDRMLAASTGRWRMKWVTRARPKTDRIACPWLIRRFIDPEAVILYVPAADVLSPAQREGGRSFDAPDADYTHRDGRCTFETLIEEFDLGGDAALRRLARIVHAADVTEDLQSDPLGPGLLAMGEGGLDAESDDHRLLERGSFVYDALYAWSARHAEP